METTPEPRMPKPALDACRILLGTCWISNSIWSYDTRPHGPYIVVVLCGGRRHVTNIVANVCNLKICTWSQKLLQSVESLVRCLHCLFLDAEASYQYILGIRKVLQLQQRQLQVYYAMYELLPNEQRRVLLAKLKTLAYTMPICQGC